MFRNPVSQPVNVSAFGSVARQPWSLALSIIGLAKVGKEKPVSPPPFPLSLQLPLRRLRATTARLLAARRFIRALVLIPSGKRFRHDGLPGDFSQLHVRRFLFFQSFGRKTGHLSTPSASANATPVR